MSPADLDLARELWAKMPEGVEFDLSESWVVDGYGRRVVHGRLAGMRFVFSKRLSAGREPIWVPDLDDPATAGVLLAMLADRVDVVSAGFENGVWFAGDGYYTHVRVHECGPTLGAALARALLAAWGPA